jgi:DnaJ-class molecular chaperone
MTKTAARDVMLCAACAGTGHELVQHMRCQTCGGAGIVKSSDKLNDPRPWRMRAEEMRTIADGMRSEEPRGVLLRLAEDYDRIATVVARGAI